MRPITVFSLFILLSSAGGTEAATTRQSLIDDLKNKSTPLSEKKLKVESFLKVRGTLSKEIREALPEDLLGTYMGFMGFRMEKDGTFTDLLKGGAAEQAGLNVGDKLVSFDGIAFSSVGNIITYINDRPHQPFKAVVERGGKTIAIKGTISSFDRILPKALRHCEDGHAGNCSWLAGFLVSGGFVKKDAKEGFRIASLGCDGGDAVACRLAGEALAQIKADGQRTGKTAEFYSRGCGLGNAYSCTLAAEAYAEGEGVKEDADRAAFFRGRAAEAYAAECANGNGWSCRQAGLAYEKAQGVPADKAKAFRLYARACDLGDAWGCRNQGICYANGIGTKKSDQMAVKMYRKACDSDNASGCYELAARYKSGKGVPANMAKNVELNEKACDLSASYCNNLGVRLRAGEGVPKNLSRAVEVFQRGCDANDKFACGNLGYHLANGIAVKKDRSRGVKLLSDACNDGFKWSCTQLKKVR